MLAIRLEDSLIEAIDAIAKYKHTNRSSIIREAIIRYLEDIEDLELVKEALKKMTSKRSIADLRKELGLDS